MADVLTLPHSPRTVVSDFRAADVGRKKAPSNRKSKNNVSFQLEGDNDSNHGGGDENDTAIFPKVKCSFGPLRPELSEEEAESMCYGKKDFKSFKKEARKLAQLTDNEEAQAFYIRSFLDVYKQAAPQKEDEVGVVGITDLACLPLATAPVRGLERYIFPGLVIDQRRIKQSLLKAQSKIPLSIDKEIRSRILASASSLLSRQTRHLARTMGHADSIVALSIYRRTFLPQHGKKKVAGSGKCAVQSH